MFFLLSTFELVENVSIVEGGADEITVERTEDKVRINFHHRSSGGQKCLTYDLTSKDG